MKTQMTSKKIAGKIKKPHCRLNTKNPNEIDGRDDQFVMERCAFQNFNDEVDGECDEENEIGFAAHLRKGFVINGEKREHHQG